MQQVIISEDPPVYYDPITGEFSSEQIQMASIRSTSTNSIMIEGQPAVFCDLDSSDYRSSMGVIGLIVAQDDISITWQNVLDIPHTFVRNEIIAAVTQVDRKAKPVAFSASGNQLTVFPPEWNVGVGVGRSDPTRERRRIHGLLLNETGLTSIKIIRIQHSCAEPPIPIVLTLT